MNDGVSDSNGVSGGIDNNCEDDAGCGDGWSNVDCIDDAEDNGGNDP